MTQRHWLAILAALCLLAAPLPAWSANDLQHFLNLGAQALKAGNALLAIQNFQQAVQKSPNNHQAWYKLAEAQFKNKSYEDAVRSATKAIYLASDKPELLAKYYAGRAWACYKAGMNGQAVVDMERATELAPDNRQYQNWLAGARQQEQRQGPGKELASVLGQEETPRDSHSRGEESQAGQTYREDEQGRSADGETRDSQASDKYESQRGRESQGGA